MIIPKPNCNEDSDIDYDAENDLINSIFPNAKFTICINSKQLDDVVTDKQEIIIKLDFPCYCHDGNPRNTEYYTVTGNKITIRTMLNVLVENEVSFDCDHRFLEGFSLCANSDCQYEVWMGS
jgi:hypothetical protein